MLYQLSYASPNSACAAPFETAPDVRRCLRRVRRKTLL